mmetsp:Transcript_2511/g.3897  ORF Transcript_2511/g.3897 Transcript_2511/m.3897 type:complete len:106 (+) Transcript_2511:559-876(+)
MQDLGGLSGCVDTCTARRATALCLANCKALTRKFKGGCVSIFVFSIFVHVQTPTSNFLTHISFDLCVLVVLNEKRRVVMVYSNSTSLDQKHKTKNQTKKQKQEYG